MKISTFTKSAKQETDKRKVHNTLDKSCRNDYKVNIKFDENEQPG